MDDTRDKVTEYITSTDIVRTFLSVMRNHQITEEDLNVKENTGSDGAIGKNSLECDIDEETEDSILGNLFSQRSVSSSQDENSPDLSKSEIKISETQFYQSVFVIKGLVTLLSQQNNSSDKLNFLNLEVLGYSQDENSNIVFGLLTFISSILFSDQSVSSHSLESNSLWKWMKEGVSAVIDLTNENLSHLFMDDVLEISKEFMLNLLHGLTEVDKGSQENVLKILSMFGANKHFGRILVDFLINKFLEVSDLLREAERFKITDDAIKDDFQVFYSSIIELWPNYIQGSWLINTYLIS